MPFRVWFTDIDVSIMNHAAIMTVLECARIDIMVRSNFFKVASKNKWYFPSQAISAQYYRPLKIFQKAEVLTKISYVDEKWIYVEQKIIRDEKIVAACIVKSTIKNGRETIPPTVLLKLLNIEKYPTEKSDLIETYELENMQMNEKFIDNWDN